MIKLILIAFLASSTLFSYEMNYDKNTTGLVRHLKVYEYPRWISKVELSSGKEIYFSSPKSMFEFYQRPGKWYFLNVKSEKDLKTIIVTDYNTLELINAKGSFFVYGSNATSPSGDDLPAFDSYKDATEFSKLHHGSRVLGFREVSSGLIKLLNGAM
ncbi:MAG: nitrous oxide reductase accessory protein NosL [Sulfurimonas sp.]